MKHLLLIFFILIGSCLNAQHRNNIWCFGDSAGIDFNNSVPVPIHTTIKSRGTCTSISDSTGQLLFYAGEDDDIYSILGPPFSNGEVFTKQHQTMQNGDSIIMTLWYNEATITESPSNPNQYYVFTTGVTGNFGLYYNTVDMTLNGGLGGVIQKNVQLLPDKGVDGLVAIKHGNGRDWWIIFRNWASTNNKFYKFLVTPSGISSPLTQNIGTLVNTGFQRFSFNKSGNILALATYDGLIETFDFDRCTGMLSNHVLIRPLNTSSPYPELWSCAFSPNSRFLYVTSNDITSYLIQIDLQNAQPWANADTLWNTSIFPYSAGALKLAPDDKIYLTCTWNDGVTFNFPYPDTLFNNVISNLSVINFPDSLDTACNFTPFSFYLGGNRTYLGLPNNPDYDMPRIQGSPCDTVQWVGVAEAAVGGSKSILFVSYIRDWQKAFINAQQLKGGTYTLSVIDIMGRLVFKEKGRLRPPYFTKDLDCSEFSSGMYIVILATDKERATQKFIKN